MHLLKYVGREGNQALLQAESGTTYRVDVAVADEPIIGSNQVIEIAFLGDRISWNVIGRENNAFQSWPDHSSSPIPGQARAFHFQRLHDFPEVMYLGDLDTLIPDGGNSQT